MHSHLSILCAYWFVVQPCKSLFACRIFVCVVSLWNEHCLWAESPCRFCLLVPFASGSLLPGRRSCFVHHSCAREATSFAQPSSTSSLIFRAHLIHFSYLKGRRDERAIRCYRCCSSSLLALLAVYPKLSSLVLFTHPLWFFFFPSPPPLLFLVLCATLHESNRKRKSV